MRPLREYLLGKQTELNKEIYPYILDQNKKQNGKKIGYSWVENCRYMCDILPVSFLFKYIIFLGSINF